MDKVLQFLVEHGGWGSIFGLIAGWGCVMLWRRNNELQDQQSRLAGEVTRQSQLIDDLRKGLVEAVEKAAADRQALIQAFEKLDAERRG